MMVSGMSKLDVDDWRRNTRLKGCSGKSPVVQWFWRAVTQCSPVLMEGGDAV